MAKLNQQPTNTSLLQPTKFQLTFSRMPNLTYFCQTFNLPGISMSEIVRNTPFVDLYIHGDKVQYEPLDITFTVDEDLRTWLEMHSWITGLTFPKNFDQYRHLLKDNKDYGGTVSDATMTVITNKNTPNIRITFRDCFPLMVSSITFDYTMDANMILTASASFRYNYFDIDIL
jgi:hypothetical protein